jgi:hypothetical protein
VERAATAPVRRSALLTPRPPEIPLLQALGFDRPIALARAGLGVDFQLVSVLVTAGERMLAAGEDGAFAVWCEVARLETDSPALATFTPTHPGSAVRDVRDLLLIKRALLGDADARLAVAASIGRGADSVRPGRRLRILLAGPTDGPDLAPLLGAGLAQAPEQVWAVAPPGPLRDGWVGLGAAVPGEGADTDMNSTRKQQLTIWARWADVGGDPNAVRVVALPGAAAEDIVLARALGSTVGRIEAPGAADLGLLLLNGAAGVVPLPADPMTLRGFLWPGHWPADLAAVREPIAAELHCRYVARQRARASADDPALVPWPALSPWLRRSNLAAVDDIPNKLAVVGLRLAPARSGEVDVRSAEFAALRDHVEQLAEMEHGRFTAERLLSGWTSGARDPARFLSPDLQPWAELDDEAKERDREAIRDLPAVLAQNGLGVRPLAG